MARLEINDKRIAGYPVIVHVKLSERNVLMLLSKLYTPGSERTIVNNVIDLVGNFPSTIDDSVHFAITVEKDEDHYSAEGRDAPPGQMHPISEMLTKTLQDAINKFVTTKEGEH